MTIEIVGSHLMMSYNYVLNHSPLAVSGSMLCVHKYTKQTDRYVISRYVCNPTERCV